MKTLLLLAMITVCNHTFAKCSAMEKAALGFINSYIKLSPETDVATWLNQSGFVTKKFSNSYAVIIRKGFSKDPELGLGYDPITISQDVPNQYQVSSCSSSNNSVIVSGVNAKQFQVTLLLKYTNNKWLVNSSGEVNVN